MSNFQMIQLLFILLASSIFLFSFLFFRLKKILEQKQKYSIFLTDRKKAKKDYYCIWYEFFMQWTITRRYLRKISIQYEIYMPGDNKRIARSTMKLVLRIWVLDILLMLFLFTRGPDLYWGILTAAYIYVIHNEVIYIAVEKNEIKLMKQFDKFLGDIRHNYQLHGMIQEAIHDSIEGAPYLVRLHGVKIYDILNAEETEDEVSKYNESVPNRFLKIFLSLCILILEFGDKKVDNQSLFLINLKNLRQEINTEVLKREKMKHLFSGLIFVCVTPMLFLKAIENWAVLSLPEMQEYYKGVFGILTMVIILAATFSSYCLINRMKESGYPKIKNPVFLEYLTKLPFVNKRLSNIINRNYGKTLKLQELIKKTGEIITPRQLILKQFIYSIYAFLICILISITIHHNNKIQLLTNYNNINYLNSSVTESQIKVIKEVFGNYLKQYKEDKIDKEEIADMLLREGVIRSKQLMTMTAGEIAGRIERYQREYYRWYELLIAFLAAAAVYNVPYLNLLIIKKLRQMNMEDEVIQFHSIILMLMHFDRMTIETILVWLESSAVIFKKSIQDCINNLPSGDVDVLEELKRKESCEPFVKLVENLQISDKIGINKAFDEIAVERFHYQEKRKLENEISINDKALLGRAIAFIAFIITIGLYLIIPFIVEGLTQYAGFMEQMKSIY